MRASSHSLWIALLMLLAGGLWPIPAKSAQPVGQQFTIYLSFVRSSADINPFEQQVVELTNQLRQQHGCPPLAVSPQLMQAARGHSEDMAENDYFAHINLAGNGPDRRAQMAGYTSIAGWENIAAGYPTADEVVSAWYNETPPNDGHRRNILNCALRDIGVGYVFLDSDPGAIQYRVYWTQDFGMPVTSAQDQPLPASPQPPDGGEQLLPVADD